MATKVTWSFSIHIGGFGDRFLQNKEWESFPAWSLILFKSFTFENLQSLSAVLSKHSLQADMLIEMNQ